MPGLNGTGPEGRGKMTGRGLGRCNTIETPSSELKNEEIEQINTLNRGFRADNLNRPFGNFYRRGRGFNSFRGRGMGLNGCARRNRGNF